MSEDRRNPKPKGSEDPQRTDTTSRARNRTVLLTPEVAGQVRALLNKDEEKPASDPLSEIIPAASWDVPQAGTNLDRPTTTWTNESLSPPEAERPPFSVKRPASAPPQRPNPERASGGTGFGGVGFTSTRPQQAAPTPPPVHNPVTHVSSQSQGPAHITPQVVSAPPARERSRKGTGTFQVTAQTKLIGFLVSFDGESNGDIVELRVGRWLLTSRPSEHGDHILIDDDSISPLHAIVRVGKEGRVQVLDQLSEFGTGIMRAGTDSEEEVTGAMVTLSQGDVIRFGKRYFVVCIVPLVALPKKDETKESESA